MRNRMFAILLLTVFSIILSSCASAAPAPAAGEEGGGLFSNYNSDCVLLENHLVFVETNEAKDHSLSFRLMVLDLENGDCMPLCGKPECTHDGEDCNARVASAVIRLMTYDGKLYWLDGLAHNELLSVNPDGTGRSKVLTLDEDLYQGSWAQGTAAISDGVLYICGSASTVRAGEPVDSVTVFRQGLREEKGEVLYHSEEYTQAFGRMAEGRFVFAVTAEDAENDFENARAALFSYDPGSGALEELWQENGPELMYGYLLSRDGLLYLGGYNRGLLYGLRDGTLRSFDTMDGLYSSFDMGEGCNLFWEDAHHFACRDFDGKLRFEGAFPPEGIAFSDGIPGRKYIGYNDGKMYYRVDDLGLGIDEYRRYIVEFDLETQKIRALYQQSNLT